MSLVEPESIPMAEAEQRGVARLVHDAEAGGAVFIDDGRSRVAILAAQEYEAFEELRDNVVSLTLIVTRMLDDDGTRIPLDAVISKMGFTREELEALPDD